MISIALNPQGIQQLFFLQAVAQYSVADKSIQLLPYKSTRENRRPHFSVIDTRNDNRTNNNGVKSNIESIISQLML